MEAVSEQEIAANNQEKLEQLLAFASTWTTEMGGWQPGKEVILRGRSLLSDLDSLTWMGLVIFTITGEIPKPKQVRLYEGIWLISTSFPDPRLWNNRVAALACSVRSTPALGISAGIAVSEATIYGHRPLVACFELLHKVKHELDKGDKLSELLQALYSTTTEHRPGFGKVRQPAKIPGFGRPITPVDERIQPLKKRARECDCHEGDMFRLAFSIESELLKIAPELKMNIALLMAALCADQGMSSRQFYYFITLCFSAGILACGIDAEQHKEGSFFPLPCKAIHYHGVAKRLWKPVS